MHIGDRIKAARLAKGYTQEDLGNLIGVQKSAVAKYESGRVVNIKRSVLVKISKTLDIPPAELVGNIEEKPIESALALADIFINLDVNDKDLQIMLKEYSRLDKAKQEQVRDFIHFLSGKH